MIFYRKAKDFKVFYRKSYDFLQEVKAEPILIGVYVARVNRAKERPLRSAATEPNSTRVAKKNSHSDLSVKSPLIV